MRESKCRLKTLSAELALVAFMIAAVFGCSRTEPNVSDAGSRANQPEPGKTAEPGTGAMNFFLDVMEIPDKNHAKRAGESGRSPGPESDRFYAKTDDAMARMEKDLVGMDRDARERAMFVVRCEILFDLRLGPQHPGKQKVLKIAGWFFDKKLPVEKRLNFGLKEKERFDIYYNKLLPSLKAALADALNDADYHALTGQKKGQLGL